MPGCSCEDWEETWIYCPWCGQRVKELQPVEDRTLERFIAENLIKDGLITIEKVGCGVLDVTIRNINKPFIVVHFLSNGENRYVRQW